LAESANQLVFGSGNPDAQVVFIGEAPGKQEDLRGEPLLAQLVNYLMKC
jgi:DNA polymerase